MFVPWSLTPGRNNPVEMSVDAGFHLGFISPIQISETSKHGVVFLNEPVKYFDFVPCSSQCVWLTQPLEKCCVMLLLFSLAPGCPQNFLLEFFFILFVQSVAQLYRCSSICVCTQADADCSVCHSTGKNTVTSALGDVTWRHSTQLFAYLHMCNQFMLKMSSKERCCSSAH